MGILGAGWIGNLVSIVSLIIGVIGVLYAIAARARGRISLDRSERTIVGKHPGEIGSKLEIRFNGHIVPRVTVSRFYIWNSGKKTINENDIATGDKLRLSTSNLNCEILQVRLLRVTRDVCNITFGVIGNDVFLDFDFIDAGDGIALEITHAGPVGAWSLYGTIKGAPKAISSTKSASIDYILSVATISNRNATLKGASIVYGILAAVSLIWTIFYPWFYKNTPILVQPSVGVLDRYVPAVVSLICIFSLLLLRRITGPRHPKSLDSSPQSNLLRAPNTANE